MSAPQRGFTLVELLIVTSVIGLLAAVMVPNLVNVRKRPYDAANSQCHRAVLTQLAAYRTQSGGTVPMNVNTLPGVARVCAQAGVQVRAGADGPPASPSAAGTGAVTPVGALSFDVYTWHPQGSASLHSSPSTGVRFERQRF